MTDMTPEEKRHDQLTTAPKASESDAAPRITVTDDDGVKRIDIADTAAVRPGEPPTKD
ncbi:multidrug transporter [Agromyces atrinae]|uniref:multidrug transporter n=1 Tax=Agromyces atrinae TaxID=592376 RepID=UPI001F5A3408|nr:multidrug transporter [Agromyces atrinae]MCI2959138.1 multidrug transporter [Agromyces atrinae]